MDVNKIATKQDIDELKKFINYKVELILEVKEDPNIPNHGKFVRTKRAKEILQVSTNKLKKMRENNEIS